MKEGESDFFSREGEQGVKPREVGSKNQHNKENLKLSLRGSVEHARSTWAGSVEEADNRIGMNQSFRPGSLEEVGCWIG